MIDVDAIIFQLRNFCPILTSVSGAGDMDAAETLTNLPLPAAYVVPLSLSASDNDSLNALYQDIRAKFAIVVALDNTTSNNNRTGLSAARQTYGTITSAIFAAILNWSPTDRAIRGCEFVESSLITQDGARAWYQWIFQFDITITSDDGFQLSGDDLTVNEQWIVGGNPLFRDQS